MKKSFIFTFVLIFMLASCTTTKNISTESSTPKLIPSVTSQKPEIKTIKENFEYLNTNIEYPQFADKTQLNNIIQNSIKNYYNSFKDFAQIEYKNAEELNFMGYIPFSYNTEYTYVISKKYTSVLITSYIFSGGNHGSYVLNSYVYNEETKQLETSIGKATGLSYKEISDYCRTALVKQLNTLEVTIDNNWINEGTEPTPGNFEVFLLTDKSADIYFEPYKVAPYSAGIIKVTMPMK